MGWSVVGPGAEGPRKNFETFCMGVGKFFAWVGQNNNPKGGGCGWAGRPGPRSAWVDPPPGVSKKKPDWLAVMFVSVLLSDLGVTYEFFVDLTNKILTLLCWGRPIFKLSSSPPPPPKKNVTNVLLECPQLTGF